MNIVSIEELFATFILILWIVFLATILSRSFYEWMKRRGFEHNVAVYYNRKILHMLGGGLCAIVVPFVFRNPIMPLVVATLMSIAVYLPHRVRKTMYWFQTEDNNYEISFCLMWGLMITLGWIVTRGNFWFGILPILFMSFGDAITGIVRNVLYRRRTKSWWGNFAMALFSTLIGATMGVAGILAGAVASVVEHFEFKFIDDNVSVPSVSFFILLLIQSFAPRLLTL